MRGLCGSWVPQPSPARAPLLSFRIGLGSGGAERAGRLTADLEGGLREGPGGRRVVAVAVAGDADDARGDLQAELDDADRLVVLVNRETGDEGDADPRSGKRLDDAVLVRAEDEVRLDPGRPQLVLDDLGRAAGLVADQR